MIKSFTKEEKSWILYDWANSAYSTIISAAILPLFFKYLTQNAGIKNNIADSYWGYSISIATLMIALIAPLIGTLGDYKGYKMKLFKVFLVIGIGSTATLVLTNNWLIILIINIITMIGFYGANIFYDSFLTDITSEERMDKISTLGYAFGYIGGSTIPFILSLGLILYYDKFGISKLTATKSSFIITALWWILFSIPMLKNVKQVYYKEAEKISIVNSFQTIYITFKNIKEYKNVFIFLIAYFFYIDGVNTIIHLSSTYANTVGIDSNVLMLTFLIIQIIAFPFAILFGRLANKIGNYNMILFGIIIYIIICILAYRLRTEVDFFILCLLVASSQGGIQALSRSCYSKMIPKEKSNEFFGFYDIFGKFAAVMGPALFGFFSQLTGNSRYGVLSILILFVIGGAVLLILIKNLKRKNI